ncbi:uncharacterized protein LOC127858372 isoform X2 [Dreissena polymorpha]|uniref:Copper transport protein n=1 Tax=Dreissena polymorpha TaxID=45954 RepID=A0A9D3Z4K3_DREPO|nr:uncharacterized protein LOC127858372 isoform X2 [Dreissena polymorpha]KAH3710666.1 hypothetical protein DPMN_070157 [Dreissena polymorpha]
MKRFNVIGHIKDYFFTSTDINKFIFKQFNFQGNAEVFGCCVMIFAITLVLEAGKALLFYLQLRLRQNPLTYGDTAETSIQDNRSFASGSTLLSSLAIPANLDQIRRHRIKYHVSGYLLHTLNLLLGYLLMLAVMTFDAYIFIAVILGSGIGYFVFGAINERNKAKFLNLNKRLYSRYSATVGVANKVSVSTGIS